jgi:threonine dehydrogenase-like Zn-dependent dehydrogenase
MALLRNMSLYPEHILYHLPDSVTFEQAAMVESVAVAAHAIDLTPINLRDTALVVGTGMIGLFLVQLLKLSNAGTIIAIDIDDQKLALAKKFGADHTFNSATDTNIHESILALTHNRGADVAFEAVGVSATIKMAIENVRKAATVTLVGNISPKVEIPLQAVVTREVRLQGSCAIAGEYGIVLNY